MKLRNRELEWLWTELAHAVEAERRLPEFLNELAEGRDGTRRGRALRGLAVALSGGRSLPAAVATLPEYFSPDAAPALEAGERTGRMAEVLRSAAERARLDGVFRGRLLHALAYPLVLALTASAAFLFLHFVLRPQFLRMYDEMDVHVSSFTAVPVAHYAAVIFFYLPVVFLLFLYVAPPWLLPGRAAFDRLRMAVPLIGRVLRMQLLARWCRSFGHLVSAGVAEPEAVTLAGRGTGNLAVARLSEKVAREVRAGRSLGDAIGEDRFFPASLVWMVGAAERRGGHADVWPPADRAFQRRADDAAPVADMVLRIVFGALALLLVFVAYCSFTLPLLRLMNMIGG